MQRIIDTNIVLRLILNDYPHQTEAATKLINKYKCEVLDIAVFESYYVLKNYYEMPVPEIYESLRTLLLQPNVEFNNVCIEALKMHASSPSISFADCYMLLIARGNKAKLYTFDKALVKNSNKIVIQP